MDATTQTETARIDELIAAYRELQAQFDRARDRLRRADENRHTVQRRIYDRVRGEYDRELDAIRARMTPLRDEVVRLHESLEAQCREASAAMQSVEDELAEADFRHRTGEYEETTFNGLQLSLDARREEARTRHALLRAALDAIAAMRAPDTTESAAPETAAAPVPEPAQDGVPAPAPAAPSEEFEFSAADLETEEPAVTLAPDPVVAGSAAPDRPVLSARQMAAAPKPDGFENPHDWISEMGPETSRARRAPVDAAPAVATAPPEPAVELAAATPPAPDPAGSFPSLVFVSGPHAGQSIALLPTTLTIGREHDNNIEIKDPEVARYHARILRQRDEYVVEDLNSSTGTWVNGERTQRAVLTHGDVIRLGQTELALDFEWTEGARQG